MKKHGAHPESPGRRVVLGVTGGAAHLGVKEDVADKDQEAKVELCLEGKGLARAKQPGAQAKDQHEGDS